MSPSRASDSRAGLGGRARRGARLARLGAGAGAGLATAQRRGDPDAIAAAHARLADGLVEVLGSMKAAAMKVGQILSFVDLDVDPETTATYRHRLAALQDAAPASDPEAVAAVVAAEYGAPAEEVFAAWEPEPFAVASIGQVHRARLPDGDLVAVKVQHPGVAEAVTSDLANLSLLTGLLRLAAPHLDAGPLLVELRERITEELDYQQEAAYQQAFVDRYAGHPFIRVPRVHHDWCRPRVLVSDFVDGASFEKMRATTSSQERDRYGEIIFRFVFGSLYRFRIFNADPHPGNYLFPGDGTVVFLDYGCSKVFSSQARTRLRAVHRAVADADPGALRTALVEAGLLPEGRAVDLDAVLGWFRLAYEPLAGDAAYTYTSEYARRVAAASTNPEVGYLPALRSLTMPADYVLLNRIQWGVNSLLARIEPTANWQRIMAELADAGPPTTSLGKQEQAFLAASPHLT